MDQHNTYDRVAQNYFSTLLKSGHDPLEAASELEDAAAFLATEGQLDLAKALRKVSRKHREAKGSTLDRLPA